MSMTDVVNTVKTHLAEGLRILQEDLPGLAQDAQKVESDPLIAAVQAAALGPEDSALLADFITRFAQAHPVAQAPADPPIPVEQVDPVPAG